MVKIEERAYTEENNYNKDIFKEYEKDIEKYIKDYSQVDYKKILSKDKRTNIVTIFSEMRSNIIKWYPFEESKELLEIGANYGEITQELVKRVSKVTAIEFSRKKAECIRKRLKGYDNLNLIIGTLLKNIKLDQKYDYITIIGTAEYAEKLGFLCLKEMIEWAKEHLKEDGKIFLAIDNKLGVKYLAGSTRNKDEVPFANYKNYIEKDYTLYGKKQLENIIKTIDKLNYKFYYPVPNYKLTNIIYTDNYLPKQSSYNIYYREDEEILFNELTFMNEAIKNEQFDIFTNSYLIELTQKEISNTRFVKYSNMRKGKYKIITKIEENVTKEPYSVIGNEHINRVKDNIKRLNELGFNTCEKEKEQKIISDYILKPTMNEYLKSLIEQRKISQLIEEIDKWYDYLKERLHAENVKKDIFEKYDIKISKEEKEKLTIIKEGFIDLLFQNIFYDGGEYIVFDQEWKEEGVPLEFIMYRSLKQLFNENYGLENKISKEELYGKYNIRNYIEVFETIEIKWQEELIDKDILDFYSEKWSRIISIEDIKFRYNQELGKVYKKLDDLQKEIEAMKNSRLYKLSKILRRKK